VNLVERELARGHEVHVAVGADGYVASFPGEATVHVLRCLKREISPVYDVLAIRRLRSLVRRHDFDIVQTHQSKAGVVGRVAAARSAAMIVHTLHMGSFGPGYAPLASRMFLAAERYCARVTDHFVSVGEELRDRYLRAGVGRPEQFLLLRSPVDIERYTPLRVASARERSGHRERLGLHEGVPVAVSIGALDRRKRHDLLIEQLAPQLAAGRLQLLIAGEGPEQERLVALADRLEVATNTFFLGYVEDVRPLLAVADVLVHAAQVEGVSQSVVQALAAGVPVVATEVEGVREVPHAPVRAVCSDGAGLANAVAAVVAGERAAPVSVEALTPWTPKAVDTALDRYYDLIETQLGRKSPEPSARASVHPS
jgi:glycosyltransferase involved in cell wall biosynthesis